MDQCELARRLARMETVVQGHAHASGSSLNLMERIVVLLSRCRACPPGPADSPGMRLVRATLAAMEGAAIEPQYDRRFWATIRAALRAREAQGRIDSLL